MCVVEAYPPPSVVLNSGAFKYNVFYLILLFFLSEYTKDPEEKTSWVSENFRFPEAGKTLS